MLADLDGAISNGLRFRRPLEELEEILKSKIQRFEDAGDHASANLYREVLDLARRRDEPAPARPAEGPGSWLLSEETDDPS